LVDSVLQDIYFPLTPFYIRVSILVLVDSVLQELSLQIYNSGRYVSILVLVDSVLQGDKTMHRHGLLLSFQSLFWWILYFRYQGHELQSFYTSFNPCFGGFCTSGHIKGDAESFFKEFQSLFWWILYFRDANCYRNNLFLKCFNPCFGGFCTSGGQ